MCSLARGITHLLGNNGAWQWSKGRMNTDRNKGEDSLRDKPARVTRTKNLRRSQPGMNTKFSEKKPIKIAYPIPRSKQKSRWVCKLWRGATYSLLDLTVVSISYALWISLIWQKLTPRIRVFLKKLTGSQLANKFAPLYGTRRFITEFTTARHLSLSWANYSSGDRFFSSFVSLRRYPIRCNKSASIITNSKYVKQYKQPTRCNNNKFYW